MEHQSHDLVRTENISILAPVLSRDFDHIDCCSKPEQREEAMKRRIRARGILSIECRAVVNF